MLASDEAGRRKTGSGKYGPSPRLLMATARDRVVRERLLRANGPTIIDAYGIHCRGRVPRSMQQHLQRIVHPLGDLAREGDVRSAEIERTVSRLRHGQQRRGYLNQGHRAGRVQLHAQRALTRWRSRHGQFAPPRLNMRRNKPLGTGHDIDRQMPGRAMPRCCASSGKIASACHEYDIGAVLSSRFIRCKRRINDRRIDGRIEQEVG